MSCDIDQHYNSLYSTKVNINFIHDICGGNVAYFSMFNLRNVFRTFLLKESDAEDNKPKIEFPPDDSETEERIAEPPVEIVTDSPLVMESSACDDRKYPQCLVKKDQISMIKTKTFVQSFIILTLYYIQTSLNH